MATLEARAANAPRLMMPIACTPGQSCWIVNHVDMNPASETAEDFTCGPRTYDGHEGTDFGLKDASAMTGGVSVLAAAAGTVLRVRDAMQDIQPSAEDVTRMLAENKGCGNGILIDHGQGWQSIYCHLKKGSVVIKPGDKVSAGQKIAEAGQSGAAEFPHLHFGLFYETRTVDPFSGVFAEDGCGKVEGPLWLEGITLDYEPMALFASGFTPGVPDFNLIRADTASPTQMSPAIDTLTYWVGAYGLRRGDEIVLDILDPDGKIFATRSIIQDRDRARQFYYVGRKIGEPLKDGTYRGTAKISRSIRAGSEDRLTRSIEAGLMIISSGYPGAGPAQQDGVNGVVLP